MKKKCLFCKKEFTKPYNESLKNWINRHKFCSRNCVDKYKIGRNLSIETKEKMIKSHIGHKSVVHHTKDAIEKIKKARKRQIGPNSPAWKGGITPANTKVRNSIQYRLWRESVFARDNWTCQECSQRGGELEAHHIKSFREYPELRFTIDNGITFCIACHKIMD